MKRLVLAGVLLFLVLISISLVYEAIYPVPPWMVGTWTNVERLEGSIEPRRFQMTISPDGKLEGEYIRTLEESLPFEWRAPTTYQLRVSAGVASFKLYNEEQKYRVERDGDRMLVTAIRPPPKEGVYTTELKPIVFQRISRDADADP